MAMWSHIEKEASRCFIQECYIIDVHKYHKLYDEDLYNKRVIRDDLGVGAMERE